MWNDPDPDRTWANVAFIPGGEAYPARWAAAAAAFRATARGEQRPYADGLSFDLFLPDGPPQGTVMFIHGGYWMRFGRGDFSHLAAGPVARGWAVAIPDYPLAPLARIAAMTPALARLLPLLDGPVVLTGHSAGGHLAARLAQTVAVAQTVARVVPISPLADLRPLMATTMNETLRLDPAEAAAESPALSLAPACPAHVWVGGDERPAFLWQARTLAESWSCPWTVAPGRHHFDVIDDLADPDSALTSLLTASLSGPKYSQG